MAGINAAQGYAQALAGRALPRRPQRPARHQLDQALRFGAGNVRGASGSSTPCAGGYDGPVTSTSSRLAPRTRTALAAAKACMTNYLILREKVRAFRADPEVQAALAAARCPSSPSRRWPTARRGRPAACRCPTSTSWPPGLRRRAPRPARAEHLYGVRGAPVTERPPPPPSGCAGRTRPSCCAACAPTAPRLAPSWPRAPALPRPPSASIVADLEDGGRDEERRPSVGCAGRPAGRSRLRGDRVLGLGLELNVDYVRRRGARPRPGTYVTGREPARARRTRPRRRSLELAREVVPLPPTGTCSSARQSRSRPGPRRRPDHRVAPNVGSGVGRLRDRLERRAGRPLPPISNDANCAAYAEPARRRDGRRARALPDRHRRHRRRHHRDGELLRAARVSPARSSTCRSGTPPPVGCGHGGCSETPVGLHTMLGAGRDARVGDTCPIGRGGG